MSSYEQALVADYAARRARLWGGSAPRPFPPQERKTVLRIVREGEYHDLPHIAPTPETPTPLNMLTPCSWRFLVAYAAAKHGFSVEEILGTSKPSPLALARHDAMALVFQHTQLSLPGVGRAFKRDHTTVIYALHKLGKTGKLVDLVVSKRTELRRKKAAVKPLPDQPQKYSAEARRRKKAAPTPKPAPINPERDWLFLRPDDSPTKILQPYAWKQVLDEVAAAHDITVDDIISDRRSHHVVVARHEAFWRMSVELKMAYMAIGRRCGGRDHATVRHGVLQHEKRRNLPPPASRMVRVPTMRAHEREMIAEMIRAGRSTFAIREVMKVGWLKVERIRAELEAAGK